MQPQNPTNTMNGSGEVINREEWLYTLPEELIGVLPQNVWAGLNLEQKKDILRQNNLLEKYETTAKTPIVETPSTVAEADVPPVIVEQGNKIPEIVDAKQEAVNPESLIFKESVEKVKEIEKESKPVVLNQDEKQRVAQETASASNAPKPLKLFGYTVPLNVVNNAKQVSDDNNVADGSTWAATLIKKIFAIFD